MHVNTGDQVIVIAGNNKGRTGKVLEVQRQRNRVVVEGVNMRTKHQKPTQQNPQGDRIQQECAVHASNVMLLDPETGKGTRKRPKKD
ncbi:MAG TPA: 50S ribosomal protein L24 [Planctomycetes bacterium]|nr:50S ribosomal protein L24 [Planctomycetota bacterium]HIK61181.1 50S ribosomal protein L24 [Planctomycetota bacterium]